MKQRSTLSSPWLLKSPVAFMQGPFQVRRIGFLLVTVAESGFASLPCLIWFQAAQQPKMRCLAPKCLKSCQLRALGLSVQSLRAFEGPSCLPSHAT